MYNPDPGRQYLILDQQESGAEVPASNLVRRYHWLIRLMGVLSKSKIAITDVRGHLLVFFHILRDDAVCDGTAHHFIRQTVSFLRCLYWTGG